MNQRLAALNNALLTTIGNLAEYAIGLAISIVIARTLGPADFGVFSFAIWLAGTLFIAANHGTALSTIRFVAEAQGRNQPRVARAIAHHFGRVQAGSVALVVLAFVALSWWLRPQQWGNDGLIYIALIAIGVASKARYVFLYGNALGHQKYLYAASAPVASAAVYLVASLVVRHWWPSAVGFMCAYALSCLAGYFVIAIQLQESHLMPRKASLDGDLMQRMSKHLWLTALLAVLAVASNRTIETFVLSHLGTASEIGFFAIAGTLTKGAVDILTSGLQATLMPVMAHATGKRGPKGIGSMVNTAIRYYWFIGLVVACAGVLASQSVVLLVYGMPYAPAVLPVQLTIGGAGLALVSSAVGAFLSTQDKQDDRARAAGWALGANVVLAFLLVPYFGLVGAAITFAAVRIAGTAATLWYFLRGANFNVEIAPCMRMALGFALALALSLVPYLMLPARWSGLVAAPLVVGLALVFTTVLRVWQYADFDLACALAKKFGARSDAMIKRIRRVEVRFCGVRVKSRR